MKERSHIYWNKNGFNFLFVGYAKDLASIFTDFEEVSRAKLIEESEQANHE